MPQTCPQINGWSDDDLQCFENISGMAQVMYVFLVSEVQSGLVATDNEYTTPVFKDGTKRLRKYELKEDAQKSVGEGKGSNKGFDITITTVIDAVNKAISKEARGLNNSRVGVIIKDSNGESQILYHPDRRVHINSFTQDTGASTEDDRTTTIEWQLKGSFYPSMYVQEPEAGWDSLVGPEASSE